MRPRLPTIAFTILTALIACSDSSSPSGTNSTDAGVGADAFSLLDAQLSDGGSNVITPGGPVTHGDQLTIGHVGPWTLQGKARGSELLDTPVVPKAGYFRLSDWKEEGLIPDKAFAGSDSDLATLNDPSNHGGRLASDTMIDGFMVPAGTYVVQFRSLSSIYAQGFDTGNFLFRGCRFHNTGDTFNTAYSKAGFHLYIHYSDFGGDGPNDSQDGGGFLHILGGSNHRVLRSMFEYVATAIQPNVDGMLIQENYIDHVAYYFGDGGADGNPNTSDNYHINGISSEGGLSSLRILRNHVFVPSPDGAVPPSYGAPNRVVPQTDCIALFQSLGGAYPGDSTTGIQVRDNYLAGAGYVIYGGGSGSKNVKVTGNKISTRFWTNGGNYGPLAYGSPDGTDGNESSNNTWADDYGDGGDGIKATSARQYPNGNGPRTGKSAF